MKQRIEVLASLEQFWLDEPGRHSNFNTTRDISQAALLRPLLAEVGADVEQFLEGLLLEEAVLDTSSDEGGGELGNGAQITGRCAIRTVGSRSSRRYPDRKVGKVGLPQLDLSSRSANQVLHMRRPSFIVLIMTTVVGCAPSSGPGTATFELNSAATSSQHPRTPKKAHRFEKHTRSASWVSTSQIAVRVEDGSIQLLDTDKESTRQLGVAKSNSIDADPVTCFAIYRDEIAMAHQASGRIEFRSASSQTLLREISGLPSPRLSVLRFSSDGSTITGAYADGSVVVWTLEDGSFQIHHELISARVESVSVSRDASVVARVDSFRFLGLLNVANSTNVSKAFAAPNLMHVEISPDNRSVLLMRLDAPALILDSVSLRVRVEVSVNDVSCAGFDSESKNLVLGDLQGDLHAISLSDGRVLERWHAHCGRVVSLEFSPNNDQLLSIGADNQLFVWSVSAIFESSPR